VTAIACTPAKFVSPELTNTLVACIKQITETEAPVGSGTVAQRLAEACGIESATPQMSKRVTDYLSRVSKLPITTQTIKGRKSVIFWKTKEDSQNITTTYRRPQDIQPEDIAIQEAACAACKCAKDQYGMPEENLAKETAGELGFDNVSTVSPAYDLGIQAIQYAIDKGHLKKDSEGQIKPVQGV